MKKCQFLLLACVICLGCKSRGGVQSSGPEAGPGAEVPAPELQAESEKKGFSWKKTLQMVGLNKSDSDQEPEQEVEVATAQNEPEKEGFSWKKTLQLVGFQKSDDEQSTSASPSQRVAELEQFANNVAEKSSVLNTNDPPEVTRSKAQELLEALRPWESVLAAGRKVGVLNDSTAQHLDAFVKQIRIQTGKLVQFTPNPQTIDVVKHLGAGFKTTVEKTAGLVTRGSGLLQAFRGTSRS